MQILQCYPDNIWKQCKLPNEHVGADKNVKRHVSSRH